MTDCRCHAGKICGACETEVMSKLNERLKGRTNYHDSEDGLMSPNSIDDIEYPEGYVKMEGKNIGKIVGKFIPIPRPGELWLDPEGDSVFFFTYHVDGKLHFIFDDGSGSLDYSPEAYDMNTKNYVGWTRVCK